ncbi:MAG: hypothetical protein WBX01_05040 [Nitrososphaeraceae archaeon]
MQYDDDVIDVGEFRICISVVDGIQGCGQGYNSEEKPESVTVNLLRDLTYLAPMPQQEPSQSQSQSQSLGPIYICPSEGECVIK